MTARIKSTVRTLLVAVVGIIVLRGALLGVPALTDPTESRYAMISCQMAESGDWITPRLWLKGDLVPYWGKPPLHFWLAAASFKAFGISTAAARLPAFLTGLATIALTGWLGMRLWGAAAGATAALILASAAFFYPALGASIIDMTLTLAVTGAVVGCAAAVKLRSRGWGLACFAFLAAGFMTKGPVALVLAGLPVLGWAAVTGRWRDLDRLPWAAGSAVFLVLVVPWFLAAERATRGFLAYFFINENFLRFVSRSYGDLYGAGHAYPYGTIWPVLVVGFLPWTVPLVGKAWQHARAIRRDSGLVLALCWGLSAAILFTFGRQWLPAYILPALPGLALATARLVRPRSRVLIAWAFLVPVLACAVVPARALIDDQRSCRAVIGMISEIPDARGMRIAFHGIVPHSAQFYGTAAGLTVDPAPLDETALARTVPGRIVVVADPRGRLPASLRRRLRAAAIVATGRWAACRW